jgi:hypothetical protein
MGQPKPLHHVPYVNARGEYIDNGTSTGVMCSWPHRDTCPLCMAMKRGYTEEDPHAARR